MSAGAPCPRGLTTFAQGFGGPPELQRRRKPPRYGCFRSAQASACAIARSDLKWTYVGAGFSRPTAGAAGGSRDVPALVAILAILLLPCAAAGAQHTRDGGDRQLRITSPLGRTGLPGTIRIVARIEGAQPAVPPLVRFYVDGSHLSDDADGPPYEALWVDESPFERREITVRAELTSGPVLADTIVLEPLLVTQSVDVTSVAVEASVTDAAGRFVRDLSAGDFEVLEDGVLQEIDVVTHWREPALFTLLVDSSQSMASRYGAVRHAASRLLGPLHPEDKVIVAPFSKGIVTVTGPTTDHETVLEAIDAIRPTGGTAILDSIRQALAGMPAEPERRAIVLITDGYDEHSESAFDEVVTALQDQGVTLYVIGLGGVAGISLKGERLLKQITEQTGGRAWFPLDDERLADAYASTADDVQHKYLLTYTPSNTQHDGTWRQITVRTRDEELRVRAREGYTAPIAPPIRASIEFTAIGTGNEPVQLEASQIEVLEDGVLQTVDTFHEAVLPVTMMLALDASGSMRRFPEQVQAAAREFVQAIRPEDSLGMIVFADTAEYIHSPTERRDWSLEAIDAYRAEGGTALYDAVYDALAQIANEEGRRAVVVVTDGKDENRASNGPGSERTWEDVLWKLQQTDVVVYAVGLGSNVDRAKLQLLADRSGGEAYFPENVEDLTADYHRVLDALRRRYVVGWESTNRARDGDWRVVEIRPRSDTVEVRSREGYYAPSQ